MSFTPPLPDDAAAALVVLRKMSGVSGRLRTASCLPKLASVLGLPRIAVDEAIRDLYRAGLLSYQADARDLPASGYLTVSAELVIPDPQEVAWMQALEAAGIGRCNNELSGLSNVLRGMSPEDLAALARCLKRLTEADSADLDDAGFNVSARHLMGSSKVLSMMPSRMLETLELPLRLQNSSPRYVICAGPPSPVATLLIENPRAFENAVRSGLSEEVALICTYGFGLSYLGQDWLHATDAPEYEKPIMVVRDGVPPPLNTLLRASHVFLWGDLDLAAINIYRALKRAVPQLQMSRIYDVMMTMIHDRDSSHPYAEIFDKSGQAKGVSVEPSGTNDLDTACLVLLRTCQTRAVDQESVSDSAIRSLGAFPLTT